MAISVKVRVTGQAGVARAIAKIGTKIAAEFDRYAVQQAPFWEELLRATVRHVVYDAYQPDQYRRTFALIDAVSSQVNRGPDRVQVILFPDPDKVELRGGDVSAGGSNKEDVPREIEEGTYPVPWYGFSRERPAYAIMANTIRPAILRDVEAIIARAIA